ncbi:MAG: GNAT family N-acetyltransferase [Casimicrobium sp.]
MVDTINSLAVSTATLDEMPQYVLFATEAQERLRARGLAQWVPVAHEPYAPTLRANIECGVIKRVATPANEAIAFFAITTNPSEWWQATTQRAVYLSGIVVSSGYKNCGVGEFILRWVCEHAAQQHCESVRLECHADNRWLCAYYERAGFAEVRRLEQHPGYIGALFEKQLANRADAGSISQ